MNKKQILMGICSLLLAVEVRAAATITYKDANTSFTYSVANCSSFVMASSGVLSCKTGTTPVVPVVPVVVVPPAPPVPVISCSTSNAIIPFDMTSPTDLGHAWNVQMNTNYSKSIQITTGAAGRTGQFLTEMNTMGQNTQKFINISTKACDFSYTQIDAGNTCASTGMMNTMGYAVGVAAPGRCVLQPNTTYYINIRNENAYIDNSPRGTGNQRWAPAGSGSDTCAGAICGFMFQLQ